jgi:hypothetical protein
MGLIIVAVNRILQVQSIPQKAIYQRRHDALICELLERLIGNGPIKHPDPWLGAFRN